MKLIREGTHVYNSQNKIKHLEFIEGVVNRLASASFQMKGWAVVLASAVLVYLSAEGLAECWVLLIVPVGAFWILDGYYLWQERLFRKLYDTVRCLPDSGVDFSMATDASESGYHIKLRGWAGAMFSLTLFVFYAALLGLILIAKWIS